MTKQELIDKVKAALADRNITVVAEKTGISAHTMYRLLNDVHPSGPRSANLYRLADYLGIEHGQTD